MLRLILALMLQLRPHQAPQSRRLIAREIYAAARTPVEARLLIAVRLHEDGFNPRARYPFGLTCCMRRVRRFGDAAKVSLSILRMGKRVCRTYEGALHLYNAGTCTGSDRGRAYASRVLSTFRQIRH
jgi:hypothetical protein